MSVDFTNKLVIGISSRALFDLDESHRIYEQDGIEAYGSYQRKRENNILEPGVAFPLVKKLLALQNKDTQEPLVEIILLSRNSADTGLRVFNSIHAHELNITRAAFTNGVSPYRYVAAFGAHLFLSAHPEDVQQALENQCAAATICDFEGGNAHDGELRIAFDGDAVLFSDEAERVYQEQSLSAFQNNETQAANIPLSPGPFKGVLQALQVIQQKFSIEECPIRTALVTARNAPAHERVIRTLRAWDIRIDEALFLGGVDKGEFLKAFGADFYFDDQPKHCQNTSKHVPTGHVPYGVVNTSTDVLLEKE